MIYDPEAPETERYRWAPLGEGFDDIRGEPVSDPGGDSRYINGHIVYPAFEAKFDELGGVRFVGEPITQRRATTWNRGGSNNISAIWVSIYVTTVRSRCF